MKIKQKRKLIFGGFISAPRFRRAISYKQMAQPAVSTHATVFLEQPVKVGLAIALVSALTTGCVGYVDGGYGGGVVVAQAPEVVLFGGSYDRGRDVHSYSHRGSVSRAAAHPDDRGRERQ
ncbi:MAG TPA: hypothetical protein VNV43_03010 [Candidatus Acidoferrales bacterium]|jgi:hypothetical protein|nr:hypothetical protein [Candidatus Acidoferrales bacterium]